jgi:hypothetical protein
MGVANLTFAIPLENHHLQELNNLVSLTSHVILLPNQCDTIS